MAGRPRQTAAETLVRPRLPMPRPVRLAVVLVALFAARVAWAGVVEPYYLLWLGVPVLWLAGLHHGHPFARQTTVYVTVFFTLRFLFAAAHPAEIAATAAGLVGLVAALSTRAALDYFDLCCLGCGSYRVRAGGLHSRFRCRDCGARWEWRAEVLDPGVFE